jgi:MFS transporter, DHA2 family, multidrug resistance protein
MELQIGVRVSLLVSTCHCSILVAALAQNTQVVHSRLVEGLRPDNPLAQARYLAAPFSLSTPSGMAALYAQVTRQAAMVAYIDDFRLIC